MEIDSNGRIAVPTEEGLTPISTFPEPLNEFQELDFFARADLTKVIQSGISDAINIARKEEEESEKLATLSLFNRVETIPTELQTNVILLGAESSRNPVQKIRAAVNRIHNSRITDGHYLDSRDLARDLALSYDNLDNTLTRRLMHGQHPELRS
tara:strand:- start:422 stop:883 length:462 start_codon:yes stop_codon:yes gene_type:complete